MKNTNQHPYNWKWAHLIDKGRQVYSAKMGKYKVLLSKINLRIIVCTNFAGCIFPLLQYKMHGHWTFGSRDEAS